MKPDIAAPGTSILAASAFDNGLRSLTGTSMATPHVAGAAALIKSAHPDYGPSELISTLMLSAQAETVRKEDKATAAQARDRGAGRARVDRAVDEPLVLTETLSGFLNANPQSGGQPEQMNLPALYSGQCDGACQFTRTFTNRSGQTLSWQGALETSNGLAVQISPANFTLADGQSQTVTFSVDTRAGDVLGRWSEARVVFLPDNSDFTATVLPLAVFASAGDFPAKVMHSSARRADRFTIELNDVAPMTRASFAGWGPVAPAGFSAPVAADATPADAFDGNGTVFQVFPLNAAKKVLMAQATSDSGTGTVELYVGRDADIDDTPDENEVLCQARGSTPVKTCVIPNPTLGHYWVMVRNLGAGSKNIGAVAAFLGPDDGPQAPALGDGSYLGENPPRDGRGVHVIGPAAFPQGQGTVQVTYQAPVSAKPVSENRLYFAAVAVGGDENSLGETAIIPVFLKQTGQTEYKPYSLNNEIAEFTIASNQGRKVIGFVDAGTGAQSLVLKVAFLSSMQVNLYRQDFDAFDPLQLIPDLSGATPTIRSGPQVVSVDSGDNYALQTYAADIGQYPPGRWYVEILLGDGEPVAGTPQELEVKVEGVVEYDPQAIVQPQQSLWYNPARDGWGADLAFSGAFQAITWYRYDNARQPTWYQGASAQMTDSSSWKAPVNHYTWNGSFARANPVGQVSVTYTDPGRGVMTFSMDDKTYSEPVYAIIEPNPPCPVLDGNVMNPNGHWYAPDQPGYGATVFVRSTHEDLLFYFYDEFGLPRWAIGNSDVPASASGREISMRQVREGFCPDCAAVPVEFVTIGTVSTAYDDDNHGHMAADLALAPPLSGHWISSKETLKLSRSIQCQN